MDVQRKLATLALLAALAACQAPSGSPALSTQPSTRPSPSTATPAPSPTAPSPTAPSPTLPPGVAFVHDGVLAPGTYWFQGFRPWLQLEIDRPGWEVGHFHDQEFDLFLDGTFPSVGFARFAAVATPASSASPAGSTPATSIDAILDAWRSNPKIVVVDLGDVEIAGLSGRSVGLTVTAVQTPLFGAAGEAFKFDPGLDSRFHLLAVEGGVVEVFVVARSGELDAALQAAQVIIDSLRTVE